MLYFTLPNFFELKTLNECLIKINIEHPEYFKTEVSFNGVRGNFPYNYWTGSYNNMNGRGVQYNEIIELEHNYTVPTRLLCDNICLEDIDYTDAFNKIILETYYNGSNMIELSNLDLMNKIIEKYPNYTFVFSGEADLLHEFTPELINTIIDFDKFVLINIPSYLTYNEKFLNEIIHKDKVELTLNSICPFECARYQECLNNQHANQYNYCKNNNKCNCNLIKDVQNVYITLEQVEQLYASKGFNHFTFMSLMNNMTVRDIINFYVKFFFKEELQLDIYVSILKVINAKEMKND